MSNLCEFEKIMLPRHFRQAPLDAFPFGVVISRSFGKPAVTR